MNIRNIAPELKPKLRGEGVVVQAHEKAKPQRQEDDQRREYAEEQVTDG